MPADEIEFTRPPMEPAAPGHWLNRSVLGLGLTSLLADLCYETATAVMVPFLAVLQAPAYALGLIEGSADALSSFFKLGAGWYSDRLDRRKPFVVFGYAVTAIATGLIALATVWPVVLLLRVLAWIGKGMRGPARNALLAGSVAPRDRGKAFGVHRTGDTLGAICGPLTAAWLIGLFGAWGWPGVEPYRAVLFLTLVPGLGSVLAVGFLVRESRTGARPTRRLWASMTAMPAEFRRFLVGVGLFGAGDFSHTLLILAAIEILTPTRGLTEASQWGAVLFALRNIATAVAAFPVGALSDRVGRRGLLVVGYLLGSLTIAGFIPAFSGGGPWMLGMLFVAAGVFNAVQEVLEGAVAADLVADESLRGSAFGVLGAVNGVGDFVSSVVVGLLWSAAPTWGFAYAATMMLLGTVVLAVRR